MLRDAFVDTPVAIQMSGQSCCLIPLCTLQSKDEQAQLKSLHHFEITPTCVGLETDLPYLTLEVPC